MGNDYIKDLMRRDPDEENRLAFISGFALDCLMDGINARRQGNYDEAKQYFATAWAFNQIQEYQDGMGMCDRFLRELDIGEYEIEELHNIGRDIAEFGINLLSAVEKTFGKKATFEFKPPFEFS